MKHSFFGSIANTISQPFNPNSDPSVEVGHCVNRIAMHPSRPNVLFMEKHQIIERVLTQEIVM
jgi:hypothetical protein